jgi:hypothetical protein
MLKEAPKRLCAPPGKGPRHNLLWVPNTFAVARYPAAGSPCNPDCDLAFSYGDLGTSYRLCFGRIQKEQLEFGVGFKFSVVAVVAHLHAMVPPCRLLWNCRGADREPDQLSCPQGGWPCIA